MRKSVLGARNALQAEGRVDVLEIVGGRRDGTHRGRENHHTKHQDLGFGVLETKKNASLAAKKSVCLKGLLLWVHVHKWKGLLYFV